MESTEIENVHSKKENFQEILSTSLEDVKRLSGGDDYRTLSDALKPILDLYWSNIEDRKAVSDRLQEEKYADIAVSSLKNYNKVGVFKNDDVWQCTYHWFSILMYYSEVNVDLLKSEHAAEFVTNVLVANLGHAPYLENNDSKNIKFLLRASATLLLSYTKTDRKLCSDIEETSLLVLVKHLSKQSKVKLECCLCAFHIISGASKHKLTPASSHAKLDPFYQAVLECLLYLCENNKKQHHGHSVIQILEQVLAMGVNIMGLHVPAFVNIVTHIDKMDCLTADEKKTLVVVTLKKLKKCSNFEESVKENKTIQDLLERCKAEIEQKEKVKDETPLSWEEIESIVTSSVQRLKELWPAEYTHADFKVALTTVYRMYFRQRPQRLNIGRLLTSLDLAGVIVEGISFFSKRDWLKEKGDWYMFYMFQILALNYTDKCRILAIKLGECGILDVCKRLLTDKEILEKYHEGSQYATKVVSYQTGICLNLSKCPQNKHHFEKSAIADEEKYIAKAVMILANLYDEDQLKSMDVKDSIAYLTNLMHKALMSERRTYGGSSPDEPCECLAHISINDDNKIKIVEAGALPDLVLMLQGDDTEEHLQAAKCIWNLSFDEHIRDKIRAEPGCLEGLQKLTLSESTAVKRMASGALWTINIKDTAPHEEEKRSSSDDKHIMISYNWEYQELVLKISQALRAEGHTVWLDVENMQGSTLDAMAAAVENSKVVILCLSETYKNSPNCRAEAEYAFQRRRPFLPLMLQRHYKPDGWLGILIGSKLYINFDGKHEFDTATKMLFKELNNVLRGGSGGGGDNVIVKTEAVMTSAAPPHAASPIVATNKSGIADWTASDVQKWLTDHNLTQLKEYLKDTDGSYLLSMLHIKNEAPEYFYSAVERSWKLTFHDVVLLGKALAEL